MVRCTNAHAVITMVVTMVNYIYSERKYISLFDDAKIILIYMKLIEIIHLKQILFTLIFEHRYIFSVTI